MENIPAADIAPLSADEFANFNPGSIMLNERRELLIGAGKRRAKILSQPGHDNWTGLVTLDIDHAASPDVRHDLMSLPYPFPDHYFDEIHAYDVLEHTGAQGDWRWFFAQFTELYRISKPDGMLFMIFPHPTSAWAWGDPGHSRILSLECLRFLDQACYAECETTPRTDYRSVYAADWKIAWQHFDPNNRQQCVMLRAAKIVV